MFLEGSSCQENVSIFVKINCESRHYDLKFKLNITFNSLRIHCLYSSTTVSKGLLGLITGSDKPHVCHVVIKKGDHDSLDPVIILTSSFAVSPDHLPAVPVHGNGVSW